MNRLLRWVFSRRSVKVLDKGSVALVEMMGEDNSVVDAARASFGKGRYSWFHRKRNKKLLNYLLRNWHTTPFEMIQLKFLIELPIFVARQFMRHRTMSFNELSRRYSSLNIKFYFPKFWRLQGKTNRQGGAELASQELTEKYDTKLRMFCELGESIYNEAIEDGISLELSRLFLPINLYTRFVVSVNAHNLMHFLKLRLSPHAQWEIQEFARAIYSIFIRKLPWIAKAFEKYRLKDN